MKNYFNNLHPANKIVVTTFVVLLSLLITMIIAVIIALPIFGFKDIATIANSQNLSDNNISFLKFLQIFQSIGLFVIPSFLLAYLFGSDISRYLKLDVVPYPQGIIIAISIIIVSSPFINILGEINSKMTLPEYMSGIERWMRESEDSANQITELFLKSSTFSGLLVNILMIAIIPAIGEEFLFRGIIQRIFGEWTKNYHLGIWISAILFSALHLQFYGFIPRIILGACFGYLLAWSGNLWFPVIAHFINNIVAVFAYHFYNKGIIDIDPDKLGTETGYQYIAIISFVLMVFLFWSFHKVDKNLRQKYYQSNLKV